MRNTGKVIAISLSLAVFVIAGMLVVGGTAYGNVDIEATFDNVYGTGGTPLSDCITCHTASPPAFNPYGQAMLNAGGRDADAGLAAMQAIEGDDSDGDTFANLGEIMALTFPGDATSFPAAVDNTAPTVDAIFPADNAVNVAINTLVAARFSEAINTTTVTDNSFIVNNGGVVTGTIAFSTDNTSATFTSAAFLDNGVTYTATLTTDIQDLAGNALTDNVVWTFTTAADNTADTTAPSVVSTSPDNNASPVAVNTAIMATFSEPIDPASVDGASFSVVNGGAVAGTISVSVTDNTVTFTPSADLAALTVYTATLSTGVTDLAGVPLDNNYVWTFTTGVGSDVTPPTVLSTVPANGATGVLVTTTISATFSEAIMNVDGFVTDGVDNVVGTIGIAGSTATFTPSSNLATSTTYTATITSAEDLSGNPLAAPFTWTFTTRAASSNNSDGGSCSITGSGGNGGGGALLFLTLLAILVTLRLKGARARR
ncbi:MAG: Ig-like domain-containing protein [Candidatus Deferrimicrobiaceae bacterium]